MTSKISYDPSAKPLVVEPEHTAVRVALWRALHVHVDPKPHILTDEVGLQVNCGRL